MYLSVYYVMFVKWKDIAKNMFTVNVNIIYIYNHNACNGVHNSYITC